jgi:PadR family transcriptional regulator PadR
MGKQADVWQGTLALMVLKTLETIGPLHGYGIARRIEQTSGQLLALNYGTLHPALLKLEQEGFIVSEWGVSENNRRAKYYRLTRAGRKQLERETRDWEQATEILARFLSPDGASSWVIFVIESAPWRPLWPEATRRDLVGEIDAHLQLQVEDNLRGGMTPEAARSEALRQSGGVEVTKERYRDRRGFPQLEALWPAWRRDPIAITRIQHTGPTTSRLNGRAGLVLCAGHFVFLMIRQSFVKRMRQFDGGIGAAYTWAWQQAPIERDSRHTHKRALAHPRVSLALPHRRPSDVWRPAAVPQE